MERLSVRTDGFGRAKAEEAREKYLDLLSKQLTYWRQRSKSLWLAEGDTNSKFFHKSASARKSANNYDQLKNAEGVWIEGKEQIREMMEYHFTTQFRSRGTNSTIIDHVQAKVSDRQNEALLKEFTKEEIKAAIDSMHPDKAPGPDGFNPAFYQKFWKTVGQDVTKDCLDILRLRKLPNNLNDTNLVLIQKKRI